MIESASLSALAGMVRPTAIATRRLATPSKRNSCDVVMPASCSRATITVLPAMNAALSTLTPATTRARRSAPAQACTAAKAGKIHRQSDAAAARENCQIPVEPANGSSAEGREAEIDGAQAQQDGADHRRQQNNPSGREPGRKA